MIDETLCVLLVDDDWVDQLAFSRLVATSGLPYDYRIARSTQEARQLLAAKRFDAVIADYYLGDGTAFDIFAAGLEGTRAPMIVVTNFGNEELAAQALKAGASDYLIKDRAGSYLKSLPVRVEQAVAHWRANVELEHNQARFQALIENSDDGVWLLDAGGNIIYANPCVERLLGYASGDFVGRNALQLVHPDSRASVRGDLEMLLSQPGPMIRREYQCRHADGAWRWLDGTAKNMLAVPGVEALAINYRDISERKRQEADTQNLNAALKTRLAERTAQLDAVSDELEAMTYAVAHDLRAPLRSIYAFSNILLEDYPGQLDPAVEGYLQDMRGGAQALSLHIDALLDLARYARAVLHRETVSLSQMAQTIVAELRDAQPARHVEFINQESVMSNGDCQLLQVALGHVLKNAWKFTAPRSEARIEFGQTQSAGRAEYFVRDNGVGFDMAGAGSLFQAFQRLHTQAEFPGLGVGLAAAQRIIRRHGGELRTEAALDQGATFYFTLEALQ